MLKLIFLLLTTALARQVAFHSALPPDLDLLQTSILQLKAYLDNGSLTSVALVQAYLANIERDNHAGLNLRAVIQTSLTDSVLAIARNLDDERQRGKVRSDLHGIPILVKDNMATDLELGMRTSAGNFALKESRVKGDAEMVRKLRQAGAIIIGKANLNEFSGWKSRPTHFSKATFCWSAVGGQTSSAYVKGGYEAGGNPLGSSSGSAVGVSAGFAAAALGTDTTGSVIFPAGRAALYGLRPSKGMVSQEGVVPLISELDAVGPMGFTAKDTAILLDILTRHDARYLNATNHPSLDFRFGLVRRNFLDTADGRVEAPDTCIAEVERALFNTAETLEEHGEVLDVNMNLTFSDLADLGIATQDIMTMGIKEDLPAYMADLDTSPVQTLRGLIDYNDAHAAIEFAPGECCQERLIDALVSPGRNTSEWAKAWDSVNALGEKRGFGYLFTKHDLDALIFAVDLGFATSIAAPLGYAEGTAPMGYCHNGAPFGILFVVKPGEDEKLLRILAGYEKVMPKRRTPKPLERSG